MDIFPETWDAFKETIRQLYVEENLSIAALMQVMESQHSFQATGIQSRKQYLSRIVRWGFNRNIKAEVMIQIAIIREKRRKLEGKPTVFTYNGREVDERKIERFIRDKLGNGQLDRIISTPAGVTYGPPGGMVDVDVDGDAAMLIPEPIDHEPPGMAEMPRAVLWVLGAARPLRDEELAIACAIMEDKDLHDYLPAIPPSWTLGIFQTDENNFIVPSSNAGEALAQLIPTADHDNLILETILKGVTQDKYLGGILKGPIIRHRFKSEAPATMQRQAWWNFLQYATLYWPSHLCRISNPLAPDTEAALNQLSTVTVDGDIFGPRTLINELEKTTKAMRHMETLKFGPDNVTLLHTRGIYNVETQAHVKPQHPVDRSLEIESAIVSPDCTMTVLAVISGGKLPRSPRTSRSIDLWTYSNLQTPGGINKVLSGTENLFAVSKSSRFLAFTQKLPAESKLAKDGGSSKRLTYGFFVLDTKSGYKHQLFSYDKAALSLTPPRAEMAFFGNCETEPTLFVLMRTSIEGGKEGRTWRRTLAGWVNIGLIRTNWKHLPKKFNDDDTAVIGIHREGMFSAKVQGQHDFCHCIEKSDFSDEKRHDGKHYQIGGRLWKFGDEACLSVEFNFSSPAGLNSIKDIWIPSPGDFIYFTPLGGLGRFSSQVNTNDSVVDATRHIQEYHPTNRNIICISSDGRYKLAALFQPQTMIIGETNATMSLRLEVFGNWGLTNCLRTFLFCCEWLITEDEDEEELFSDASRAIDAAFHPYLPILAGSRPIFIDGMYPRSHQFTLQDENKRH
ncbi:uncharacterized protein GIQ15_05272 [Arthroderma uncinatum]|uniref:uncharacterized protein n=1 Tax=Arthroderma uncinatum TaxID=74035 RepID=UPI00144AE0A2|nr:uncharacterized protein GIQ15_05272 [Arthroderma uncinatum]KAF3482513.1 hypothetical protein GIQ15_05272 [Arthroderma uncinatum]